jgi:hypothetical protein
MWFRGCRSLGWLVVLLSAIVGNTAMADDENADGDLAAYDAIVEPIDREHWSYLPVTKPPVPAVTDADWVRNPIDGFILATLEKRGWKPAAPAKRRELLRRVYLDVIGLPPSPAEQQKFLADNSPVAFERVVDGLLKRKGYGERWARHWLDVVRYAETNGYERDAIKPSVWRYRDYVIDAFNNDKPYNRFVLEQLAGDELPDSSSETLIATGFYRLGPWDDEPADPLQDHSDQLDDLIRTTSEVFLGMTLGCARCHNHKFDALSMHDYYRMAAIFNGLQRPQAGRGELDLPAGSGKQLAALAERDRDIAAAQAKIKALQSVFWAKFIAAETSQLPRAALLAFRTEPGKRTAEQNKLAGQHAAALEKEIQAALPDATRKQIVSLEQNIAKLKQTILDLPRGYFLHEPSPKVAVSHLLLRGRASNRGPQVQPGLPTVLVAVQPKFPQPAAGTSLRRLTLARWVARSENPLTARVVVNRVWQRHFGAGLVRTPNDFGVLGDSPTHPKLLDWLADWFVHDANWSLKRLHRLILTSNTFRMSKQWNAEYGKADPTNQFFWRFPYSRLEVEAIRDSMLAVSGRLNRKMHGPSTYLYVPKEALDGHSDPGKIWKPFDENEASRRTVYAFIKRSMVVPLLEVLDLCDSTRSSERRNVTSVPTQALTLFNGNFVNRQARHFATRLQREAADKPDEQIEHAWTLALCRPPRADELKIMQQFLANETQAVRAEATKRNEILSDAEARQRALVQMCRVIFNLNEFVYPN